MIEIVSIVLDKDSNTLRIGVEIEDKDYFKDVYIDKVVIDNNYTYLPGGPSSDNVYSYVQEGNKKTLSLEIPIPLIKGGVNGKMLFIYAVAKGTPGPTTPCGQDINTTVKVAADYCSFYSRMMPYVRQVARTCDVPRDFIDSYLQFDVIRLAVITRNYSMACTFWNKFYSSVDPYVTPKCGCNG